jgi:hypothetical protein
MKPHEYPTRINAELWIDLVSCKKITNKSINLLLNEGIKEVVRKTKEELGHYRKDRETIRTVSSFR